MVGPGQVAVVRFPRDQIPTPAVAIVHAVRFGQALVSKWGGYSAQGSTRQTRWSKRRWVPLVDVARAATERERVTGAVIEPLPPRVAACQ